MRPARFSRDAPFKCSLHRLSTAYLLRVHVWSGLWEALAVTLGWTCPSRQQCTMEFAKLLNAFHLQIAKCIEAIRECVRYCDEAGVCGRGKLWGLGQLLRHRRKRCTMIKLAIMSPTAEGDTPIPAHLFDADGELDMAHIFCSKCQREPVQVASDEESDEVRSWFLLPFFVPLAEGQVWQETLLCACARSCRSPPHLRCRMPSPHLGGCRPSTGERRHPKCRPAVLKQLPAGVMLP